MVRARSLHIKEFCYVSMTVVIGIFVGESHGGGVGVVVDGCPPKLRLSEYDIQKELDKRRPGQVKDFRRTL